MKLDLSNKNIFIAGASRGIGYSIAQAFLEAGSRVVITGRNQVDLTSAKNKLSAEFSADNIISIVADMSNSADISLALATVNECWGRIDTIVANVGYSQGTVSGDIPESEWLGLLRANLLGSVFLIEQGAALMAATGGGSIIAISSIAGIEDLGAPLVYSAAKAALNVAVKNYARKFSVDNIRVNAVAPGNVLFPGGRWQQKLDQDRDKWQHYIATNVPLKRFAMPDEIAGPVVFLASKMASFITGTVLVVDGGQTHGF